MPILMALLFLFVLALAVGWFLRARPASLVRVSRLVLLLVGGIAVGGVLISFLYFLPALLPELLGLAGIAIVAIVVRALRRAPSGGFSSPGARQRTEVRTAFIQAWIDHGSGDVGGTVRQGRFVGRTLDALADSDLLELHQDCRGDAESLRVLEAYLDRRLGGDWRQSRRAPVSPRIDMDRAEALAVLGLAAGASAEDIRAAHRRLIQRVHPDVGGSADLAARINRAKDVLLVS